MRRAQHASSEGQPRGVASLSVTVPLMYTIEAIPGHWEGDLMTGSQNSHIATLVERRSRFIMLVKVPGKVTTSVVTALSRHLRILPVALRRSLYGIAGWS